MPKKKSGAWRTCFRSTGDFEDVVALRGASRGRYREGLGSGPTEAASRQRPQAIRRSFFFTTPGMGTMKRLSLVPERLPLRDLRSYLEQLTAADVRVAFVDACQSGALTGRKGGKRAPGYEVALGRPRPGQRHGHRDVVDRQRVFARVGRPRGIILQSEHHGRSARGRRHVPRRASHVERVYQFAFNRTLANTAASLVGGQHPTYDYRMAGAGEVVLTRTRPRGRPPGVLRVKQVRRTRCSKRAGAT